jgi:hypothetical protein
MFTMQVTFGNRLKLAEQDWKKATGGKPTDLLNEVASWFECSRGTIRKAFGYVETPTKPADREMAAVLVMALGANPDDFGLSGDDVSPALRKRLPGWVTAVERQFAA